MGPRGIRVGLVSIGMGSMRGGMSSSRRLGLLQMGLLVGTGTGSLETGSIGIESIEIASIETGNIGTETIGIETIRNQ